MTDQHDAAAVVVMLQVIVPRIAHIVVAEPAIERRAAAAGHGLSQAGERELPIERRVRTARRREPRKLLPNDIAFRRVCRHVAVGAGIGRNRGVDVEAIDRRVGIRLPRFARQLAIGRDDGGAVVDRARVLATRTAQPVLRICVIVFRRRVRLSEQETEQKPCEHIVLPGAGILPGQARSPARGGTVTVLFEPAAFFVPLLRRVTREMLREIAWQVACYSRGNRMSEVDPRIGLACPRPRERAELLEWCAVGGLSPGPDDRRQLHHPRARWRRIRSADHRRRPHAGCAMRRMCCGRSIAIDR